MPTLNRSPGALAGLRSKDKREETTRLFEETTSGRRETMHRLGAALHLDLPTDSQSRYHLIVRFTKTSAGL
jgi:hypothetical protein